jgi:hypothetical protein
METALGSSRRDLDQDDPETGLQEVLVTGMNGLRETRRNLSIGAPDLTGTRALPSTTILGLHATEIDAQRNPSIGTLDLFVMETEAPASLSTETFALHVMEIDSQPALSIGVLGLHATETGTLPTRAPSDPSETSVLSMTTCQ